MVFFRILLFSAIAIGLSACKSLETLEEDTSDPRKFPIKFNVISKKCDDQNMPIQEGEQMIYRKKPSSAIIHVLPEAFPNESHCSRLNIYLNSVSNVARSEQNEGALYRSSGSSLGGFSSKYCEQDGKENTYKNLTEGPSETLDFYLEHRGGDENATAVQLNVGMHSSRDCPDSRLEFHLEPQKAP